MAVVDLPGTTTASHVKIDNDLGIRTTPLVFTFAAWIKIDTQPGTNVIWSLLSHQNNTTDINSYYYYRNNSGTNRIYVEYSRMNIGENTINVAQTLNVNQWYFIAYTSDGTTMRAYLDNVELGNVALTAGNGSGSNVNRFSVGAFTTDLGLRMDGKVAHVFVYNEALSVARLEHLRWKRPPDNDPGLVLYWPLDENTGTVARDHSGNNYNGTIGTAGTWALEHPPTTYK